MCTVNTQEGLCCCCKPKATGWIKYTDIHLNSCADLQLSNNNAEKRQNPGAFPSENFHSYLMSTIIIPVIGAFHLEASPNALQVCVYIWSFAQQWREALVWAVAAILCYLQCPWAPSHFWAHNSSGFSSLTLSSNLLPLHFSSTSLLASLAPTLALQCCISCPWTALPPLIWVHYHSASAVLCKTGLLKHSPSFPFLSSRLLRTWTLEFQLDLHAVPVLTCTQPGTAEMFYLQWQIAV